MIQRFCLALTIGLIACGSANPTLETARPELLRASMVAGCVIDSATGGPVESATVRVPGTLVGMLTDKSGFFLFALRGSADSLFVGRTGYATRTIAIPTGDDSIARMRDISVAARYGWVLHA